jgi:hypothetical protein
MDMREAAAMTEASGVVNERDGPASEGSAGAARESGVAPPAVRLSEWLRKTASEAPLQSLAVAFLLGVLVARRR